MKYRALIFDMDGTIVDTNTIWQQATKKIFENRGHTITPEFEKELDGKISGLALHESCKIIKDITNCPDPVELLMQEKSAIANELFECHVQFMEGFTSFHQKAVNLKLKIGLATNADDATLHITNRKLNLAHYFGNHMYNISHVNNKGKPDPALYIHTAQQLETYPQECIAIEDSHHGIKAAIGAGMFCIGYNSAKNVDLLSESHLIVDHYDTIDLEDLLEIKKKC